MSAVTGSAPTAAPGNSSGRPVRDSLIVAKRNLIRMSRIPNSVRSHRPGFISPRIQDPQPHAVKEQVK
ncbi:integral membrane transport protein [Streptomyces sp. NPDC020362]|uniref:integral membrane transport protein n=1 Tax=unclassified Streptomyces TaxID=2593676 RepID=UPI000B24E1FA